MCFAFAFCCLNVPPSSFPKVKSCSQCLPFGVPLWTGPALCKGDCTWNAGKCKAKTPSVGVSNENGDDNCEPPPVRAIRDTSHVGAIEGFFEGPLPTSVKLRLNLFYDLAFLEWFGSSKNAEEYLMRVVELARTFFRHQSLRVKVLLQVLETPSGKVF